MTPTPALVPALGLSMPVDPLRQEVSIKQAIIKHQFLIIDKTILIANLTCFG